jgi:hypothetical protein
MNEFEFVFIVTKGKYCIYSVKQTIHTPSIKIIQFVPHKKYFGVHYDTKLIITITVYFENRPEKTTVLCGQYAGSFKRFSKCA